MMVTHLKVQLLKHEKYLLDFVLNTVRLDSVKHYLMEQKIENVFKKNQLLKNNVKKKCADERALEIKNTNFECRVKKINAQLTQWKVVKNDMEKLNLDENNYITWTNQQLRNKLFLKKRIDDRSLPNTKDNLIKLWGEWKDRLETDWNLVKEQVEQDDHSHH